MNKPLCFSAAPPRIQWYPGRQIPAGSFVNKSFSVVFVGRRCWTVSVFAFGTAGELKITFLQMSAQGQHPTVFSGSVPNLMTLPPDIFLPQMFPPTKDVFSNTCWGIKFYSACSVTQQTLAFDGKWLTRRHVCPDTPRSCTTRRESLLVRGPLLVLIIVLVVHWNLQSSPVVNT